jgi:hypothetical protein
MMAINVRAHLLLIRAVLPFLKRARREMRRTLPQ